MITIIDLGMGNMGSICNMLRKVGVGAEISSDPKIIEKANKLILPGVGAFDNAVRSLKKLDLKGLLDMMVIEQRVPILGICLGMQLFTGGSEEGSLPGFGWVDAETVRLGPENSLKIPHMGWNTIGIRQPHPILDGLGDESRFYFVHSYHVKCKNPMAVLATTHYGVEFHSVICKDNIVGTQFHPEKSHWFGMTILRNFAEIPA